MATLHLSRFRNSLQKQLLDLGVNLHLGDHIEGDYDFSMGEQEIRTRNGEKLVADLVIQATGGSVNDAHLKNLVPNLLSRGGVKVKPTFQIEGHDNIFAIGDLADLPEQKQAAKAPGHAAIVNKNILATINGQPLTVRVPVASALRVRLITMHINRTTKHQRKWQS